MKPSRFVDEVRKSDVSRLLQERNAVRLKEELGTEPSVYYLL